MISRSLLSSVFDPIGLFALFSIHMRRILKTIWTNNEQHSNKEVEPVDEVKWKVQRPLVAETSFSRSYFNATKYKTAFHLLADAPEDAFRAVAYLHCQL